MFSFLLTFPLLRLSKSPTVFHSGRHIEGFSKVGAGVGGIIYMCVCHLRLKWKERLWYILLIQLFRKFSPRAFCCHPTLCPSLSLSSLCSPLPISSFPQGGSLHLKWHSTDSWTECLSLQTPPPWVCGQSLLFWFSGDSSSIMWRLIPRLRAVGTQVGT